LQPADAADLVQEVFTLLVQKMPEFTYDRGKSFRSWLRIITLNKWRDRCRRLAVRPHEVADSQLLNAAVAAAEGSLAETEYRQHLVARALELMQAEFQPTTWQACWEFVVVGRPAAEVGQQLGISENAVLLAKSRVLRRLRQELEGLLDD
jgi:RNA polymerase sigma-70 factor (ECF subfamily)